MKEILLPTDFSRNALNAIFTAIKLQKDISCNFIILHVYQPDKRNISSLQDDNRTGMIYSALHKNAMNKLEETLTTISEAAHSKEHSFEIKAASGDLASIINELVPKKDIDMVIMGTKGATGAKQIFLGSNTVRVLKKIRNCPILAIPESFNFQSLHKIVFPTEFAHFFSKNQLNQLLELAKFWSSELLVFQVAQEFSLSDEQKANKILLQKRFESLKYSFHKIVIHTTVAEAINKFANEQLADMICLIHYNHTFMEKLTQEPVVSKVGFQSEIPLLVLPE